MSENPSDVSRTLNFLTDAGHALARLAPETSAHLMSRRNALMLTHDLTLSDVQRQHVCSSCGHLLLLGDGSTLRLENAKSIRRKAAAREQPRHNRGGGKAKAPGPSRREGRRGPAKVITCDACGRWTSIQLPPPAPAPGRRDRKARLVKKARSLRGSGGGVGGAPARSTSLLAPPPSAQPAQGSAAGTQPESQKKTQANSSSKKRARSRKAGLQALLEQTKSSASATTGGALSLANFFTAK